MLQSWVVDVYLSISNFDVHVCVCVCAMTHFATVCCTCGLEAEGSCGLLI